MSDKFTSQFTRVGDKVSLLLIKDGKPAFDDEPPYATNEIQAERIIRSWIRGYGLPEDRAAAMMDVAKNRFMRPADKAPQPSPGRWPSNWRKILGGL